MHNKFDAVLFDLDGTLTDSGQGIVRSVQFALESLGVKSPPENELLWCVGPPVRENLRRLLATSDSALIERGVTLYLERYEKIGFRENRVYDGISEMLATLARRCRLLIVTTKLTESAEPILAEFSLRAYFEGVFGTDRNGEPSDKADLVRIAIASHGLSPSSTAMVGDRRHDIAAGKRNGLFTIGAGYGYGSRDELAAAGADIICDSPAALVQVLCD
jgi:phosphoglycolate phosphatase